MNESFLFPAVSVTKFSYTLFELSPTAIDIISKLSLNIYFNLLHTVSSMSIFLSGIVHLVDFHMPLFIRFVLCKSCFPIQTFRGCNFF